MQRITMTEYCLPMIPEDIEARAETNRVIIHHSAAPDSQRVEDIARYHVEVNGWSAIGYHYIIERDGTIAMGRPRWAVGAHAYGANFDSIGVCVLGNFNNDTLDQIRMMSLCHVIAQCIHDYDLDPDDDVIPHRDVAGDTSCPGINILDKIDSIRALAAVLAR